MRKKRLVLAALVLMVVACRHAENTDISTSSPELSPWDKDRAETSDKLKQVMATIAKDHPESELWLKPDQREFITGPPSFSLEFQDRVAELDGKKAIILAQVLDVYRAGNDYRMLCGNGSSNFLLRCSADQARHIVDMRSNNKDDVPIYGVVCRVTELSVTLDRIREARVDDDDPYISEGELQPWFYLIGDCVALYYATGIDNLADWWDYLDSLPNDAQVEGKEGLSEPPH